MKKIILSLVLLLITTSVTAGRYYYRSYYYGTPDDSGKWGALVVYGLIIIVPIILMGIIITYENISEILKINNIRKYKKGAWTMPISTNGKLSVYEYQHIQEVKSDKVYENGNKIWVDNKLIYSNGIWAPVFYGVKLRVTKDGKYVIFDKAKNLNSDYLILSKEKAAHIKRPIFGKNKITIGEIPSYRQIYTNDLW
jgi:hypothetical protein